MAIGTRYGIIASSGSAAAGIPTRSISFTRASSQSLSMSNTNFGAFNRAKWAYSTWFKRGTISTSQALASKGNVGNTPTSTEFALYFDSSDRINFLTYTGSSLAGNLITTATYTDMASFHHLLVWYDSANATAGDRMRMWFDGVEITAFGTDTNPSAAMNTGTLNMEYGVFDSGGSPFGYYDGLKYQQAFFSGTLPLIGSVYNAGHPVDVSALPGLWSLLNTNATDALEDDYVIATNWTNTNSVIKSVSVPA